MKGIKRYISAIETEDTETEEVKSSFYELHRGQQMDVTSLRNVDGFSTVHCAMMCSAETTCHAVKPISTSGNDVMCELYAEPEAGNIVSITDIYVKNVWKEMTFLAKKERNPIVQDSCKPVITNEMIVFIFFRNFTLI